MGGFCTVSASIYLMDIFGYCTHCDGWRDGWREDWKQSTRDDCNLQGKLLHEVTSSRENGC